MGLVKSLWRRIVVRVLPRYRAAATLAHSIKERANKARREEKKLLNAIYATTDAVKELLKEQDQRKIRQLQDKVFNNATSAIRHYEMELTDLLSIFSTDETIIEDIYKDYAKLFDHLNKDIKEGINITKARESEEILQQYAQRLKEELLQYRQGVRREARGRKARGILFSRAVTSVKRAEKDMRNNAQQLEKHLEIVDNLFEELGDYEKMGDEERTFETVQNIISTLQKATVNVEEIMDDYFISIDNIRKEAQGLLSVVEKIKDKLGSAYYTLVNNKNSVEQTALREARAIGRQETRRVA